MTTALLAETGHQEPGSFQVARRVAERFEEAIAHAFVDAVTRLQDSIEDSILRAAIASGSEPSIEAAAGVGRLEALLIGDPVLTEAVWRTSTVSGTAGAELLTEALGVETIFNARHPDVVRFAREQVAELVVGVGPEVKEAIRIVVAYGADIGLTPIQQARAIREIVGLPKTWARAPLNLAQELRDGHEAKAIGRRLSAADKARITSRIRAGTVTEEFVEEMQERYAKSLLNRRGINIAGTESRRAAHYGQRNGWIQAVEQRVLPDSVRRVPIVTADERLRETHAEIPGMNPHGVRLDEPFDTPMGKIMDSPFEPLCRCGQALIFDEYEGVL